MAADRHGLAKRGGRGRKRSWSRVECGEVKHEREMIKQWGRGHDFFFFSTIIHLWMRSWSGNMWCRFSSWSKYNKEIWFTPLDFFSPSFLPLTIFFPLSSFPFAIFLQLGERLHSPASLCLQCSIAHELQTCTDGFSMILQLGFEFLFILPSHFGVRHELVWDSERCDNLKRELSGWKQTTFFHCTQCILYVNTA